MNWMRCSRCAGHGQVSDYGALGLDFLGPKECRECGGSGLVRARDYRGRFARRAVDAEINKP